MAKPVDWEAIEREYRAGQLSVREIARQHDVTEGAIRKKAKANQWERDLTQQVQEAVRAKLVRTEVRSANVRDIVDHAAERGVEIVRQHRAGLARQNEHLILLQEKLEALMPEIASLDGVEQAQGIVESMARTRARLVPLERQAFNLDKDGVATPTSVTVVCGVEGSPNDGG